MCTRCVVNGCDKMSRKERALLGLEILSSVILLMLNNHRFDADALRLVNNNRLMLASIVLNPSGRRH